MKSPLSQAFFVPDVHPRLRKHLARCTLDCGSKTSESPALRGFVGGPRALATAALYLVLLSNGLHRPKIRLKKFGFSSKTVPANIAKKLPPQRCSKPLFIPLFNFSHKQPTFAFMGKNGYTHSAFGEGSHTAAYTPKQGPSLPRPQHGLELPAKSSPKEQPEEADARLWRVSASSGVAAPLGRVIFFASVEIVALCPVLKAFRACERGGGITTTLGVFRVSLKRWTAACQKGSFVVF